MGRPRLSNEPRVPTAVRLPQSLHERLMRAADDRQVSANLLVTHAIEEYLDRLPSAEQALTTSPTKARRGRSLGNGSSFDPEGSLR